MNKELWHKAEEIAAKNYFIIINEEKDSNGQPNFLARIQEFYGCMAQGQTKEEALANLKDASIDYIYSLLNDNINVPEPTSVVYITSETNRAPDENELTVFTTVSFGPSAKKAKKSLYVETKINF